MASYMDEGPSVNSSDREERINARISGIAECGIPAGQYVLQRALPMGVDLLADRIQGLSMT